MVKKAIVVGCSVLSLAFAGVAFAAGADSIVLKGGAPGNVTFPHKLHQEKLKDCNLCHKMFAKEAGSIEKDIASGKIKKKDAMKMCIDCHKATKAKGQPSGPTGCSECHKK